MDNNELRDKVIRLETTVEHLKEVDSKLERKIMELENKILLRLDELTKNHTENFNEIKEYMSQQKGGWKALTIAGTIVATLGTAVYNIIKFFS